MQKEREIRRQACIGKTTAELSSIASRGVLLSGQAFSSIVLLKGNVPAEERALEPLGGPDGEALRAALAALGYAPEDWAAMLTCKRDGTSLESELLREAICALDPATVVLCDKSAAEAFKCSYPEELSAIDDFNEAMLMPGQVVYVLGMRVLALGGFADALGDNREKQRMWSYLKKIPPLGEPY